MFRKVCVICAALSALGVFGGCVVDGSESGENATIETQTESYIDLDSTKEHALGLVFGMPQVDDRLDYEGGDREDWRYIIVTEEGTMSITMNIDSPSKIMGGWNIIDSEGRVLHREAFSQNVGYYEFKDFPVKRGVYYFQTFATQGKSIYTIAPTFRPKPAAPVIAEEVYDEPEPEPVVTKPRSSSGGHHSSKSAKSSDDSAPAPAPAKSEPADTGKKVKGFISLITEKSDGSAEVTIRDAGKNKGVETGMVGYIEGTKIKIETTQCFPTQCRALIPASANPKSFKKGANVIFNVN